MYFMKKLRTTKLKIMREELDENKLTNQNNLENIQSKNTIDMNILKEIHQNEINDIKNQHNKIIAEISVPSLEMKIKKNLNDLRSFLIVARIFGNWILIATLDPFFNLAL